MGGGDGDQGGGSLVLRLLTRIISYVSVDCQAGDVESLNDITVPLLSVFYVMQDIVERLSWHITALHPALQTDIGCQGHTGTEEREGRGTGATEASMDSLPQAWISSPETSGAQGQSAPKSAQSLYQKSLSSKPFRLLYTESPCLCPLAPGSRLWADTHS